MFLLAQNKFRRNSKLESFPDKGILHFIFPARASFTACVLKPCQAGRFQLLFQKDTDDNAGILWGDCGVANFFISEQDLVNRRFSREFFITGIVVSAPSLRP
jgi:uncharacterized protein YwqG